MSTYENHIYADPELPIIFHLDQLKDQEGYTPLHWHENIELLYFVNGSAEILLNNTRVGVEKGGLVIVNPEFLHCVNVEKSKGSQYYCLIVDKSLYSQIGTLYSNELYEPLVKDQQIGMYFQLLVGELEQKKSGYRTAAKQLITLLFLELQRNYQINQKDSMQADSGSKKIELVKASIEYIRRHYREPIKTVDICAHIGFSQCYFCHVFKEVTGKTVVNYINFLRCTYARKLLQSGSCNVCESAEQSGFNTLSYFSKIYKKTFGKLPSEEGIAR